MSSSSNSGENSSKTEDITQKIAQCVQIVLKTNAETNPGSFYVTNLLFKDKAEKKIWKVDFRTHYNLIYYHQICLYEWNKQVHT